MQHSNVEYNNKQYIVGCIKYNDNKILFVFDGNRTDVLDKKWHFRSDGGYIANAFRHTDNKRKELYLHNFVMDKLTFNGKGQHHTIDHINRIPTDNRVENLRLLSQSHQNINQSRRERKVELPTDCGFTSKHLPKNIYYVKSRGNHGDRFNIEIKCPGIEDINWFSTSSKTESLKVKLQQSIYKLLDLKEKIPELGNIIETIDNVQERNNLIKSYNEIIKLSNFDKEIIENNLQELELELNPFEITEQEKKRAFELFSSSLSIVTSKLNPDCVIKQEMIPKYCYYIPESDKRGDKFVIERHPAFEKQKIRSWATTGSKKITTEEKFNLLMEKYNELITS